MSDWVNCNKCVAKYNAHITFFLTECGHIFCQRCVEKIKISKKCLLCGKTGNVLPLNKDVEQSVMDFFSPVENFFKKAMEVYKFQLQHRRILCQNMQDKYTNAKKEYQKCHNSNKQLMKENQMLRSMLRATGQNVQRFSTSTPLSHSSENNNLTFHNTSMLSSIPPHMGITPSRDNPITKMYPGFPKRNPIFSSGSSHKPSPAQRVPLGGFKQDHALIHRNASGTMRSLAELRRSGNPK